MSGDRGTVGAKALGKGCSENFEGILNGGLVEQNEQGGGSYRMNWGD